MKVTVRSTHVMYRYSPSLPTIHNYHPPPLIISILPHTVIAVQHKQKDRHPNRPSHFTVTQLHYSLHQRVTLKYRLCK